MKITFNRCIKTMSGTFNDVTFSAHQKRGFTVVRKFVIPRYTEQNLVVGGSMQTIARLWPEISAGFKQDLANYTVMYSDHRLSTSYVGRNSVTSYVVFVKLIWGLKKHLSGSLDIESLTIQDIRQSYRQIDSISSATRNHILQNFPGTEQLRERI